MTRYGIVALALLLLVVPPALAQAPLLTLPQPSPSASVTQQVGVTEITIAYHRPAVGKRKIWGDLVPYDEVWRAGANENTTISFSSPVTIGGKKLVAGTYGLHMLPTQKDWTIILSTVSSAWGSFSYDAKEDAVRVTATPTPASFEESLEYRFENPTENSVNVVLQWEKIQVAFPITVDTKAVALESLKGQLRGLGRFFWQDWNQAAQWCLRNNYDLDQGLAWADRSIDIQPTFANLRTKAYFLEKKGTPREPLTFAHERCRWPTKLTSTTSPTSSSRRRSTTRRSRSFGRTSTSTPTRPTSTTAWARRSRQRATKRAPSRTTTRPCP